MKFLCAPFLESPKLLSYCGSFDRENVGNQIFLRIYLTYHWQALLKLFVDRSYVNFHFLIGDFVAFSSFCDRNNLELKQSISWRAVSFAWRTMN
jgi:hypothetical protein